MQETPKIPPPHQLPLKNKVILVVDDSKDHQILVNYFLTGAGAKVDIAENGKVALEMIEKNANYHAVLMDVQMPVLGGYETLRILREQGYRIPIIAFTANAMKEEQGKSILAGFSAYLAKPIQRQSLISTLVKFLVP